LSCSAEAIEIVTEDLPANDQPEDDFDGKTFRMYAHKIEGKVINDNVNNT